MLAKCRILGRLRLHALTQLFLAFGAGVTAALTQELPDRGTFVVRRGVDTIAVDRFSRTADTLRGSLEIKGEPGRLDYVALLSNGDAVRSLHMEVYAIGGGAEDPPLQRLHVVVQGDTMFVKRASGVERVATTVGAIPMFAHAWALTELFTRRARRHGDIADVPFFAVSGGVTLNVTLRPVGSDSLVMTMDGQATRLRADAAGRILGGMMPGPNFELLRAGGATRR